MDAGCCFMRLGATPVMKPEVADNLVFRDVPSICWLGFHDGPVLRQPEAARIRTAPERGRGEVAAIAVLRHLR
jgi:hypothetical protein